MEQWPIELIQFLERPVPIFIHLAAAKPGMPPFTCRGYGVRLDLTNDRLWIFILQSQWLRLNACTVEPSSLAVLLTSGTDNESYQIKGSFERLRNISKEDRDLLANQRKWTFEYFPTLLPLVAVDPSNCIAISLKLKSVYLQTPGPNAGSLLVERS